MLTREKKARIFEMYVNGSSIKEISTIFNSSVESIRGVIKRDYLGVVYSSTPTHIIKKSKV